MRDAKRTAKKKLTDSIRGVPSTEATISPRQASEQGQTSASAAADDEDAPDRPTEDAVQPLTDTVVSRKPKRRIRENKSTLDSTAVEKFTKDDDPEGDETVATRRLRRDRGKGTRFDDTAKLEDGGRRPRREIKLDKKPSVRRINFFK